ncbi:hypothetical protein [Paenibacillus turpanensis]|nr:hypothetical protein [Paenibacillus turpanensis]
MRNILMTVMLLVAVALLFTSVIGGTNGTKAQIQNKGTSANTTISNLSAG